jgi:TolB-like protein
MLFKIDTINCFTIFFLLVILCTINLHAATRILTVPFTVMPLSKQSIAEQINHTISFTFMHQPEIKIVQHKHSFSSSEILSADFQRTIDQIASAQNCSHIIYGSVNFFGQRLSINAVLLNRVKQAVVYSSTDSLNQIDQIPDWLTIWLNTALNKLSSKQLSGTLNLTKTHIENIHDEIIGMDIADIHKNSGNEILLYGPKQITLADKDFNPINIRKSGFGKTVVFARWIDHSSTGPSLVISETTGSDIITGLYQWKDNQWQLIHHYSGWFITLLEANHTIISQQRRYSDYWGDIMQMQGQLPDKLVPKQYEMPIDANIFDFNVIRNKKKPLYARFDNSDYLKIFRDHNLVWRSSKPLGGSIHFIDVQKDSGPIDTSTRKYIPSRLCVVDMDNDQSDEIIVCENIATTGRLFENTRWFSQGVVHIMSWTGSEMQIIWTSKKQPGPVTAYALEKKEKNWRLWIACVLKQQNLFRKGLSRIAVYDIQ